MRFLSIITLSVSLSQALFSQAPLSLTDRRLDSIMNRVPVFGKTTLLYFSKGTLHADTLLISTFKSIEKDSSIFIKFAGKTEKSIKAGNFWGYVTDYGERKRMCNGQLMTVWHTQAPYIYKVASLHTHYYFFSETLTGKVYPLSPEQIFAVENVSTRRQLLSYMEEQHIVSDHNRTGTGHEVIYASAEVLWNLCGIVLQTFTRHCR